MIDLHLICYVFYKDSDMNKPVKVFDNWMNKAQFRLLISSFCTKEYDISCHEKSVLYKFFYKDFIVQIEAYFVNDDGLHF